MGTYSFAEWFVLVQHELLLFAGVFFLLGAIDDLAIDLIWLWLRLTGRGKSERVPEPALPVPLTGRAAVLVPAWHEAAVIGATVRHMLSAWPHADLRLYVGCYPNDPATAEAVESACGGDPRARLVLHERNGPTTKADCLNRLYRALEEDEMREGVRAHMVVLHDAEDMVDPLALGLLDAHIGTADLVQLPVLPHPMEDSRWIASHYVDEFAAAHGGVMVVRDALGASLPTAGVGCAIAREPLARIASARGSGGPFAADSLTEDYELGLGIGALGGPSRFVRARAPDGRLIATRACFPAKLDCAVRQKTRWVLGIAFQSWDRLGWGRRPVDVWMRFRDRRGPLTALLTAIGYLLVAMFAVGGVARLAGLGTWVEPSPLLVALLILNLCSLVWRAAWRFAFTAREHGVREGFRAILRIPVANIIAIMAGRRAFAGYLASLAGRKPRWDKTRHTVHPALRPGAGA
ncbi:glycosyl transferase family protein [Altererythrobacter aerius]|uniref:Glycosyl transferase family protein n=1 Tax=Tsuneonella aeria TaxID=1837929 RepID=A0A6I4TET3_9SPHN|nr:glycosyl transferase family protein [Tsuneonella aeria]MXO74660.1 glycosyl transferase family protein [Tsuneonella aeria]